MVGEAVIHSNPKSSAVRSQHSIDFTESRQNAANSMTVELVE